MSRLETVRVLYMEDDEGLARLLQRRLSRRGYRVDLAYDGASGLAMYQGAHDNGLPYHLLVVDHMMPGHDGLEVMHLLAAQGPLPPLIVITGSRNEQIAVEAMKLGARDYLIKDTETAYLELLPSVIEQVMEQERLAEEKRHATEALRQRTAELEARNQELEAFSRTVAHDLKNPLAAIIGLVELLLGEEPGTPEEQRQDLARIATIGHKMDNIIRELLLLASVSKQEVASVPLDMGTIVQEVLNRLDYMIQRYHPEVSLPDSWPVALGYGPWIEEVWANYLNNALKYGGRPPRVEIGATVQPDGMVRFWLRDNGHGLSPAEQGLLFVPFTRLTQARIEGQGLGLSIVQRIVEKVDGQVGVESEVGQGSTFWFTLPQG